LTLDLWPWTFAMYRLWRDETLYQIWTQSSNTQRSYCDLNIWPNDLERRVACCAWLWDNFHQVWPWTTYPCLNNGVFMLIHYVTLWPWPLTRDFESSRYIKCHVMRKSVQNMSEIEKYTAELLTILRILAQIKLCRDLNLWPLDLELLYHFGCQAIKHCTKSLAELLTIFTFSPISVRSGTQLTELSQVLGPIFTKLGQDIGRSSQHCTFVSEFRYFVAFLNAGGQSWVTLKTKPNFALFDPLWN